MQKLISLIGAPMWLGQGCYGVNLAPDTLRSAGLAAVLAELGQDIVDLGNIPIAVTRQEQSAKSRLKNLQPIAAASVKIAKCIEGIVGRGRFPLLLGGDHSVAIGTLAGLKKHYRNLGVIWYDAHADINTPETTPSGNIHGMPLAIGMGLGAESLLRIGGNGAAVKPENIVFIGVRDIDPGEAELIAGKQIKVFSVADVARQGMPAVIKQSLQYLSGCDGIHLSFDIDGIDPAQMPGVGTPAAGGISYEDSLLALQVLHQAGAVTSVEFVELNPLLDTRGVTVQASLELIAAFFGRYAYTGVQSAANCGEYSVPEFD